MFNFAEELPPLRAGYLAKLLIVAAILVLAGIAFYIWRSRIPRVADGRMVDVVPFQVHHSALADAEDMDLPFLVLADVHISNMGQQPLSIFEITGTLRLENAEYRSIDVDNIDFSRVFLHYPELSLMEKPHVPNHAVLAPGAVRDGMLIFHFPISERQWKQRNSFHVDVSFEGNGDLILNENAAVPSGR